MDLIQIVVLAIVQGITEFLPISSSGHLILIPHLTKWPDQGLAYDVAAHLGSLAAVVLYFKSDMSALSRAWLSSVRTRRLDDASRLAWFVLLGTLPVGAVGLIAHQFIAAHLRATTVIATTTLLFGLLLWWADASGSRKRGLQQLSLRDVIIIGLAQALALVPGTSRSGVTITAGLALGLTRSAAAKFSFLLSVPVIVLASGLEIAQLSRQHEAQPWGDLLLVVLLAFGCAYACVFAFMKLIERIGVWPFVVYRCALAGWLLVIAL